MVGGQDCGKVLGKVCRDQRTAQSAVVHHIKFSSFSSTSVWFIDILHRVFSASWRVYD
jgi:hypothetical protein